MDFTVRGYFVSSLILKGQLSTALITIPLFTMNYFHVFLNLSWRTFLAIQTYSTCWINKIFIHLVFTTDLSRLFFTFNGHCSKIHSGAIFFIMLSVLSMVSIGSHHRKVLNLFSGFFVIKMNLIDSYYPQSKRIYFPFTYFHS